MHTSNIQKYWYVSLSRISSPVPFQMIVHRTRAYAMQQEIANREHKSLVINMEDLEKVRSRS
jgi:hypothetical protein